MADRQSPDLVRFSLDPLEEEEVLRRLLHVDEDEAPEIDVAT